MEITEIQAELMIDAQAELGEGPHWDAESKQLYWVDVTRRKLRIYNRITGNEVVRSFDRMISAVIPTTVGGLALAMEDGVYLSQAENSPVLLTSIEAELPLNRLNDAKCDRQGRLWVGTISLNNDAPDSGGFYVVEPDGFTHQLLSGIGCSNGMAWDYSRSKMYYIDTPTRQVDVFDYEEKSGRISNRRVAFRIPTTTGYPDGMTIDSEGMLWVAHWGGGCVSRWNPETGEQLGLIRVPAPLVTSCTFGGSDLTELYITTARIGMHEKELRDYPFAGGLFMAKPGMTGLLPGNFQAKE
ncbi:SMP-30/gluconolactonase/LRE family protein [Paenibacillus sp. FSL R5-0475]|nr:SMP-30/gluconolactonase/LRE family protein [Paenibacillus odorifer]